MEPPDADQKTEAPTPKRRREAAERGEVWQSRELGTLMVTLAGVAWLAAMGPALVAACALILVNGLKLQAGTDVVELAAPLAMPLLLLGGGAVIAGVAGPLVLGSRWSGKALAIKPSRLDPLAGLKRMASPNGLVELAKAIVKALLLGGAAWLAWPGLGGGGDLGGAAARLGGDALTLLWATVLALAVVAAIDLPWTRLAYDRKLRMTPREVRDENRESNGNPEVRARQRAAARAAARAALAPAMAEATVVTINPAEFAVALRYVPGRDAAPIVVARGADIVAAAIRDLARARGVPMLRYPALTRAIYFTARVGSPIRADLYGAVATVLAFVFAVDADAPPPDVDVPAEARFDERGRL